MDPVAVGAGCAFPGEVFVGSDRVVDGDGREVEEEGLVLGLGFEPARSLVGEHLHDPLFFPAWRIQFEDLRPPVLRILGPVGRLVVIAVGRRAG